MISDLQRNIADAALRCKICLNQQDIGYRPLAAATGMPLKTIVLFFDGQSQAGYVPEFFDKLRKAELAIMRTHRLPGLWCPQTRDLLRTLSNRNYWTQMIRGSERSA